MKRLWLPGLALSPVLALGLGNAWVLARARPYLVAFDRVEAAQVAIVPGCLVYSRAGRLSPPLQARVDQAIGLYRRGLVPRLLMTGDHGQADYDEVNSMRVYAERQGVPRQHIFLDHAGFNTYESMVRARRIFGVDSAVVVTNDFHLARAVFLARAQGIRAQGLAAPPVDYPGADSDRTREIAARLKAFINCHVWRPDPAWLGPSVPITGSAALSQDQ